MRAFLLKQAADVIFEQTEAQEAQRQSSWKKLISHLTPCQVKQSHGFSLHDLTAEVLETCVVWEVDLVVGKVCASASGGWQKETAAVFYEEGWTQAF